MKSRLEWVISMKSSTNQRLRRIYKAQQNSDRTVIKQVICYKSSPLSRDRLCWTASGCSSHSSKLEAILKKKRKKLQNINIAHKNIFLRKSVSPRPLRVPLGPFQSFSKIRGDISESMCQRHRREKRKFWGINFFHILLRAYLRALYFCRLNFWLFFIFRSRQAGIVRTVLSAVWLTLAKNLSAVSLTPVKVFRRCRWHRR